MFAGVSTKEKREDFDSLSFIELLVVDHSDIFLMENWEHVLQVHLHLLDSFLVDSSRVRTWNLNTRGRRYMQTLVFSSIQNPQIDNTSPNVVPTTEDRWDSDVFFPGASMITITGFLVFFP
ncbi:hypothetical protein OJAV_G00236110 [Oryzias javanicus]|uniref:UTP25 NTP hydrolase-like domain-containing protein n=1 Tax=Oryzias javanicus TaxID=123683 RepID=A0A3S2P2I0_ORYJA|nr:hypothetical protein OJAV_G00236110 [Oryzias javanicus]